MSGMSYICQGVANRINLLYNVGLNLHIGGMTLSRFKSKVEEFLSETGTAASRLGREALNDPKFVSNLRSGTEPREKTRRKVLRAMSAIRSEVGGK
jgi:hypothetical protein